MGFVERKIAVLSCTTADTKYNQLPRTSVPAGKSRTGLLCCPRAKLGASEY